MNLCGDVADLLRPHHELTPVDAKQARNAIKMYVFVLSWISTTEETEANKAVKPMPTAPVCTCMHCDGVVAILREM